jgi:hypothetical protein
MVKRAAVILFALGMVGHVSAQASDFIERLLLIRNTGGVWFAAGIPKLGDD